MTAPWMFRSLAAALFAVCVGLAGLSGCNKPAPPPKKDDKKDGTTPAAMKKMHETLKGSRFVELPGAGHISNMDQPALFTRAVREFLSA